MSSLKGKDVLIIDDQADVRLLARKILEGDGANFHEASSVKEALELISKHAPQVILTDLSMPERDGFEFLVERMKSETLKAIPTLVLSGMNDKASVKKALSLGATDYMLKPFRTTLLLQKVRKALKLLSFQTKKFDPKNRPKARISFGAEILQVSEVGFSLESPVKLSPEMSVEVKSELLEKKLDIGDVAMRTTSAPAKFSGGRYVSEINFVGVGEAFSKLLRVKLKEWK